MFGISSIMVRQPLFQICGIANISLIWKFFRLYKINIKHIRIYIIFSHTSSRLRVALLCLNGSSYVWRSHPKPRRGEGWCGRRESNPRLQLGKLTCCHYTTPAIVWCILYPACIKVQHKKHLSFSGCFLYFSGLGFILP